MATQLRADPVDDFVSSEPWPMRGRIGNVQPLSPGAAGAVCQWVELLARISHDLRTPLNAVIGFSDAMQNEVFGPLGNARYQEYARHIRQSGDLVLRAAEDTLAMTSLLASPQSAVMDKVELAPLLDELIGEIRDEIEAVGASVERVGGEHLLARADGRLLRRALRKLLSVAVSRAIAGSEVVIEVTASHGVIGLAFRVCPIGTGMPQQQRGTPLAPTDPALGREELRLQLARLLLDLNACPLKVARGDDYLVLETELEQAAQVDFFSEPAQD